jgi:hypothetical protein
MEDVDLGGKFWLGLLGIVVGTVLGAALIFLFVAGAWARWGFIGALIFCGLILAGMSYVYNRAHDRKYDDTVT